jgi:DNA replication licensing factor MCM7
LKRFFRDYEVHIDLGKAIGREWDAEELRKGDSNSGDFDFDDTALAAGIFPVKKYQLMVERIVRRESKVIEVWIDDLDRWREKEEKSGRFVLLDVELRMEARELPHKIENNTMRYLSLMEEVLDEMVKEERENEKMRRRNRILGAQGGQDGDWQQSMDLSQPIKSGTQGLGVRNGRRATQDEEDENAMLMGEDGQVEGEPDDQSKKRMKMVQAKLRRVYELRLIPRVASSLESLPLRMVRAEHVGKLVTVQGIVTRVTEVKPMLLVATYSCDTCGNSAYQLVNEKTFMPLRLCGSAVCKMAVRPGKMVFHTRGSKFSKFQQIKLQELSHQVPIGHIPRTLGVHVVGELTRKTVPGDVITVKAIFLPISNQGFHAMRHGIVADTYMLAQSIEHHKKRYSTGGVGGGRPETLKSKSEISAPPSTTTTTIPSIPHSDTSSAPNPDSTESPESIFSSALASLGSDMAASIEKFLEESEGTRYKRLAQSIAPEIYGHDDVKKAMLLQMVGGVTRVMEDGMRNRGDINICLMGDPGVAKSQLLKSIQLIAPRAVYTSGKGSTGVGLTAAILRDPVTKEFVLEGGSLTIADMGICCIDEFDKMDESDRTAIHEVMEQQTISIAKAGITTTLNARTAVLAAANPAWGRYNPRRTPSENINLPASLLSRFDLMFLILDRHDSHNDRLLAQHITHVHRTGSHPPLDFTPLDPNMMRAYISIAKMFEPWVPPDLTEYIVQAYCTLRQESDPSSNATTFQNASNRGLGSFGSFGASSAALHSDFGFLSARSLLAILRLSQALARLRFSHSISKGDIDEAIRLMNKSKNTLFEHTSSSSSSSSNNSSAPSKRQDETSAIYTIIREHARLKGTTDVNVDDVSAIVLLKGYSQNAFDNVLDVYDKLGVWSVSANRRIIKFTM